MSYGGLMGFDTSSIPDDAVVTSVILHLCPMYWESDNESPQRYLIGSTYNDSFIPITGGFEVSPDDFYGDFAEFTTSDIPICMGEGEECSNWNQSVYMNIPLNADGLVAVNKSGLTILSVRLLDSINEVCPIGNTLIDSVFFTTYEVPEGPRGWYPQSWVTVNWEEPSPIPHMNSTVTVMAEIVGILFVIFGILLLVFVLFNVEGLGLAGKTGMVFGISILLILGVIITMAMINAFK
jgi:hypothetical protein